MRFVKNRINKAIIYLLSCVLMMVSYPHVPVSAASNSSIPEGVYSVDYFYMKYQSNSVSVANDYLKTAGQRGTLIVDADSVYFEHEVTVQTYQYFPFLGSRIEGHPVANIKVDPVTFEETVTGFEGYNEVEAVPAGENKYRIKYSISDPSELQDLLMHIDMQDYNHWYNVQLKIDVSSLPGQPGDDGNSGSTPDNPTVTEATYDQVVDLIALSITFHDNAQEGEAYGEYAEGSKEVLKQAIERASSLLETTEDNNATGYANIYNELKTELDIFKSRQKLADRSNLVAIANAVKTFLTHAKKQGDAAGSPGSASAAIREGEYETYTLELLEQGLQTAEKQIADPAIEPQKIEETLQAMQSNYNLALESQYVQAKTYQIYALDTLEPTNEFSKYADELENTVTILAVKKELGRLSNFRANLTLKVSPDAGVTQSYPTQAEPIYAFMLPAGPIQEQSTSSSHVFQVMPVNGTPAEDGWLGVNMIRYSVEGVSRDVYISYNADVMEKLKQTLLTAEQLIKEGTAKEDDNGEYMESKTELMQEMEKSEEVTSNLASRRPVIRASLSSLQAAVDSFKETIIDEENEPEEPETPISPPIKEVSVSPSEETKLIYNEDFTVIIPAGANDSAFQLTVQQLTESESEAVSSGITLASAIFDVNKDFNGTFKKTVTLQIKVDSTKIPSNYRPAVHYFDEAMKSWKLVSNGGSLVSGIVSVQTDHFTKFAVLAIPNSNEEEGETDSKPNNPVLGGSSDSNSLPTTPPISNDQEKEEEQQTDSEKSPSIEPATRSFSDIENHWGEQWIRQALELGIVNGYSDGTFGPNRYITRLEFIVLLSRALGLEYAGETSLSFHDESDIPEWAKSHIQMVMAAGIVNGYGDGTFRPYREISRAEIVVMIARAFQLQSSDQQGVLTYVDAGDIPSWAKKEVVAIHGLGWINGRGGNRFSPNLKATRSESIKWIMLAREFKDETD